jgi:predicted permease
LRAYRLIARAARFEAADLATAQAEATFMQVCHAAARRGSLALATVALRELAVVAVVIALAWFGRLPSPRLPRGLFSPRDFLIGARSLFRTHRGFVAMATLTLAVAVGVNLLVFTVVNALWIRPLPFPEPERVVTVMTRSLGFGSLERPEFEIFEGVAGQALTVDTNLGLRPQIGIDGVGRELEVLGVTPGYFRVFGLPIRGRDFRSEDDDVGAEPVAIIGDRLWAHAFGRRAEIIGAVVPATPIPIRIIGVAPPEFEGARRGERADMWIPTRLMPRVASPGWQGGGAPLMIFGRLGPEQTVETINERYLAALVPEAREWETDPRFGTNRIVVPVGDVFGTPDTRSFMVTERDAAVVVSGLAMLVLLGGCATIAALVLVHYERRRGELALKISLGAPRGRLVLDLIRDLFLIGAVGTAGGIFVAALGLRLLPALSLPGGVDIGRLDLTIDWRVCAAAIAATMLTLLGAAALPIARSTRSRLAGELFAGLTNPSLASQRVRQALLAAQVAATIVVLVSAGLFVRAVIHGFGHAPGFDVDRTVFVSVQERMRTADRDMDRWALIAERTDRLARALRELPGVIEVAAGPPPIGPDPGRMTISRVQVGDREHELVVGQLRGSPELLSALGVPLLAGRLLTAADSTTTPHPAIVTQLLVERLWPDGEPLGQTLRAPNSRFGAFLVVGISGDLAFDTLAQPANGVVVTAQPLGGARVSFVIRTDHPEVVAGHVRRTIQAQMVQVTTGRELVARDLGRQRLGAWFFSGFGLAALLLGIGGAFGLVAYLAESRQREFGVRLALGADMRHLVRTGLAAALVPVSAGVAAGLVLAGGVSRLFTSLLAGISALDPATYLLVAATMLGCATLAALAAAWRLRRTSPSDALRAT